MLNCWLKLADDRPTFAQLVQFLEKQLAIVSDYLPIATGTNDDNDDDHIYI